MKTISLLKQRKHILLLSILTFFFIGTFVFSLSVRHDESKTELLIHDVSRLFPVEVYEVVKGKEETSLVKAVKKANEEDIKISIAGTRHSQGGHIMYPDSIHLDMTSYNKILNFDKDNKTITVQSGATWADIQNYVNEYGLSVKVMQSSNIFTVGGSLSSNVHGRDIRYGPLIETVNSFRLLTPKGNILNVSRQENPHLFFHAIGGFGLFGVILDVELQLTDDALYKMSSKKVNYKEYANYFKNEVLANDSHHLHIARLSTAPSNFLTDMYAINYEVVKNTDKHKLDNYTQLEDEKWVRRNKFIFGLSRKYDWGKELVWTIQEKMYSEDKQTYTSRNNAMRPEIQFLEYESVHDTDILQEYFVPTKHFSAFIDDLRHILIEDDVNVFNVTVRYVPKNTEAVMSYAAEDAFAIVPIFNQGLSKKDIAKMEQFTQKTVDALKQYKGTYYLTYQLYPSKEQLKVIYPNSEAFFEQKRQWDPSERFMNQFYEKYGNMKE